MLKPLIVSWISTNTPFKPATYGSFSRLLGNNIGRYLSLNTPNDWAHAEVIPLDPQGNSPLLIFRNRSY